MQADWFTVETIDGATLNLPGIYRWEIDGVGVYVGRYTWPSRLKEYRKNVARLHADEAYRPSNSYGFRAIHRALASASQKGCRIKFVVVENCSRDQLNERERWHISLLADAHRLNGRRRMRVLKSPNLPPLV